MAILNIKDRVFAALFGGQSQVQFHLAVGGTGQQHKAEGVGPNFFHPLARRNKITGTFALAHRHAVAGNGHQLVQNDGHSIRVQPQHSWGLDRQTVRRLSDETA